MLDNVKNIIVVLSGKGGVGKSTISSQIALTLVSENFKVGLLDIDLCGPNIPYLLQLENREILKQNNKWLPVYSDESEKLAVISMAYLLNKRDDPVIWRGAKKSGIIQQFLNDVDWGQTDYLIIDTPPGTSDEHITFAENFKNFRRCDGAIIVTSSQQLSTDDVQKQISFCRQLTIPILGIVENMSGFVCPNCSECTNIFSSGGGKALAEVNNVPFLGELELKPLEVGSLLGKSCVEQFPDSKASQLFKSISQIIRK